MLALVALLDKRLNALARLHVLEDRDLLFGRLELRVRREQLNHAAHVDLAVFAANVDADGVQVLLNLGLVEERDGL